MDEKKNEIMSIQRRGAELVKLYGDQRISTLIHAAYNAGFTDGYERATSKLIKAQQAAQKVERR